MRQRTLRKYLIIYLSFFVLLVALYVPMYTMALALYTQSCLKTNESVLDEGLSRLEQDLGMLRNAAQSIMEDSAFGRLSFLEIPVPARDVIKVMKATRLFFASAKQISVRTHMGLVLPSGMVLLEDQVYPSLNDLYARFSYAAFGNAQDFFAWLTDFPAGGYLHPVQTIHLPGQSYQALTYALRLPLASASSRRILFMTIKTQEVVQALSLTDSLAASTISLYDSHGTLLMGNALQPSDEAGSIVLRAQSTGYGLVAVASIDESVFEAELAPFKSLGLGFALAYLLMGIVAIAAYSHQSAKPMLQLLSATKMADEAIGRDVPVEKHVSVYQYVHDFLNQTQARFQNYEHQIAQQELMLRAHTLERLMDGTMYRSASFERAERYFPHFPAQYRLINMKMEFRQEMELAAFSRYRVALLAVVSAQLPERTITHFIGNECIAILDASLALPELSNLLSSLRDLLLTQMDMRSVMIVSEVFEGMARLYEAYQQTHLMHRLALDSQNIVFREEMPTAASGLWMGKISVESMRYHDLLLQGERTAASALVEEEIRKLTGADLCVMDGECIQYVFYAHISALTRLREEMAHTGIGQWALPAYDDLTDIATLLRRIDACAQRMCRHIEQYQKTAEDQLVQRVLRYVDENLGDPLLYSLSTAEALQITERELKRIMLRATGKTFFDYVDTARMALALRLVTQTQEGFGAIVHQCGYHSNNTFYKAFRRTYGVSPSQMRKAKQSDA